jgi:hypothetical protein
MNQTDEEIIIHLTKCINAGKVIAEYWDTSDMCIHNMSHSSISKSIYITKVNYLLGTDVLIFNDDHDGKILFNTSKRTKQDFYDAAKKCAESIRNRKEKTQREHLLERAKKDEIYYYSIAMQGHPDEFKQMRIKTK